MNLEEQFQKAVEDSVKITTRPPNRILLQLYSLYKQATIGDINMDEPRGRNFVAKLKHQAWKKQEGKSQKDSKKEYVNLINSLKD